MVIPALPLSPSSTTYNLAPSRSTSTTRSTHRTRSSSYPPGNADQPFPSPVTQTSFFPDARRDPPPYQPPQSYGVGVPASPGIPYSAFETDAFAPIWRGEMERTQSDPWARMRMGEGAGAGAFSGGALSKGFKAQSQAQKFVANPSQLGQGGQQGMRFARIPTPPEEEEEDEEMEVDESMEVDEEDQDSALRRRAEEQSRRKPVSQGLGGRGLGLTTSESPSEVWGRGRRKT